jgi:hypothetical protein
MKSWRVGEEVWNTDDTDYDDLHGLLKFNELLD